MLATLICGLTTGLLVALFTAGVSAAADSALSLFGPGRFWSKFAKGAILCGLLGLIVGLIVGLIGLAWWTVPGCYALTLLLMTLALRLPS